MKTFKELIKDLERRFESLRIAVQGDLGESGDPPEAHVDHSLAGRITRVEQAQVGMITTCSFDSNYSWSANDYKGKEKNGIYLVPVSTNIQDFPSVSVKGGILTVKFGSDTRGIQEYVPRSTSDLYIRSYWDGSWTDWVKK